MASMPFASLIRAFGYIYIENEENISAKSSTTKNAKILQANQ